MLLQLQLKHRQWQLSSLHSEQSLGTSVKQHLLRHHSPTRKEVERLTYLASPTELLQVFISIQSLLNHSFRRTHHRPVASRQRRRASSTFRSRLSVMAVIQRALLNRTLTVFLHSIALQKIHSTILARSPLLTVRSRIGRHLRGRWVEECIYRYIVRRTVHGNSSVRRILLLSYVPSGFWSRLLTRLLGDELIPSVVER